ncbi:MAG: hypothetical protein RQ936_00165 [Gammaproteobacteria bacterium]|nr:hypothetical protein [Gammaproteobacteria bacterium]
MSKPSDEELESALKMTIQMREKGIDPFFLAKSLLKLSGEGAESGGSIFKQGHGGQRAHRLIESDRKSQGCGISHR